MMTSYDKTTKIMKTRELYSVKAIIITLLASFFLILSVTAQSQIDINEQFSKISVEGPVVVYIGKSDRNFIEVEKATGKFKNEEMFEHSVKNGILSIKSTGKENDLQLMIHYTNLESLSASGLSSVKSRNTIEVKSLSLSSDGATDIELQLKLDFLLVDASAATTVRLKGDVGDVNITSSGAADIKAGELNVKTASIQSSGASDVKMNITDRAEIQASGASNVKLKEKPLEVNVDVKGASSVKYGSEVADSEFVTIFIDSLKTERKKFNGHWGGIELGFNAIVDNQFNTGMQDQYDFLNLNQPKSLTVQLNLLEQNIPIIKNNLGLVTGLGLWVNNYRFDDDVKLVADSAMIFGFKDTTQNYLKSKLTASYLVLPLIIEYQLHNQKGKEIFHVAIGGYGGVKLGSKTKTVYMENGRKIKTKDHNDFKMSTFKYGLIGRIGWRNINFFANYNLSAMFQKNKGPEVYPFEVGITLLGW